MKTDFLLLGGPLYSVCGAWITFRSLLGAIFIWGLILFTWKGLLVRRYGWVLGMTIEDVVEDWQKAENAGEPE